jgi:hypothetical protein
MEESMQTVVIEVLGGVASTRYCPENINCIIIDFDNIGDSSFMETESCPICKTLLNKYQCKICNINWTTLDGYNNYINALSQKEEKT